MNLYIYKDGSPVMFNDYYDGFRFTKPNKWVRTAFRSKPRKGSVCIEGIITWRKK